MGAGSGCGTARSISSDAQAEVFEVVLCRADIQVTARVTMPKGRQPSDDVFTSTGHDIPASTNVEFHIVRAGKAEDYALTSQGSKVSVIFGASQPPKALDVVDPGIRLGFAGEMGGTGATTTPLSPSGFADFARGVPK